MYSLARVEDGRTQVLDIEQRSSASFCTARAGTPSCPGKHRACCGPRQAVRHTRHPRWLARADRDTRCLHRRSAGLAARLGSDLARQRLLVSWAIRPTLCDCSCDPSHSSEGTSGHFSGALDTNPPLTTAEGEVTIVEVPLEFLPLAGLRIGDRVRVSNAGLKLLLRRG
jgi:hypothetical protein